MGRHASGEKNYRLSSELIALIIVLLLVGSGVAVWFAARGGQDEGAAAGGERTCVSGELVLPVAATNEAVARQLISDYAASAPVVRDYCVRPELTAELANAAVYIAPATTVTLQQITNAGRTAAVAEPHTVYADTVGVAGANAAPVGVSLSAVRFPTDSPAASAVIAAVLAGSDAEAIEALSSRRVASAAQFAPAEGLFLATSELSTPAGMTFTPLDAAVEYAAIPLSSGGGSDENQARAGQDFARFAAERFDSEPSNTNAARRQPVISELVWAAAMPDGGENL